MHSCYNIFDTSHDSKVILGSEDDNLIFCCRCLTSGCKSWSHHIIFFLIYVYINILYHLIDLCRHYHLILLFYVILLFCLVLHVHAIQLSWQTKQIAQHREIYLCSTRIPPNKQKKQKTKNGWTQVLVEWQALSVSNRTHTVILIVKSYDRGQKKNLHQWENVHWHLRNWYFVTANKFLMTTVEFALR